MSSSVVQLRRLAAGNGVLDTPLTPAERSEMIDAASVKIAELFDIFRIDHRRDHNTRDTPTRVARMYVEEILDGRFAAPPAITEFDNAEGFDSLITTGPIELRSMCAHHLMPIYGSVVIGIVPAADGRIIGLSKYDRIVHYFGSRFQIQEELVKQIQDYIVQATAPRGLAVRVSAVHMCKTHRGVRGSHHSRMVTTTYFGALQDERDLRREFLQECAMLDRQAGS